MYTVSVLINTTYLYIVHAGKSEDTFGFYLVCLKNKDLVFKKNNSCCDVLTIFGLGSVVVIFVHFDYRYISIKGIIDIQL